MDRKEFLSALWFNVAMPLLLIGVLIFSIIFLVRVFTHQGAERFVAVLVAGFIIFWAVVYLLGLVFKKIKSRLNLKLPAKFVRILKITGKVLDYLLPVALGMIIYHSWKMESTASVAFFGGFLMMKIIEIVKTEKAATLPDMTNDAEHK